MRDVVSTSRATTELEIVEDRQVKNRFREDEKELFASVTLSTKLVKEYLRRQKKKELMHAIASDTAKRVSQVMRMRKRKKNLSARLSNRIRESRIQTFRHSRNRKQAMMRVEAAEAALKDRQRKLRKTQREANEAQRVLVRLRVKIAERLETQEEELSSYVFDDFAISSSRHQSSSQQGNLLMMI